MEASTIGSCRIRKAARCVWLDRKQARLWTRNATAPTMSPREDPWRPEQPEKMRPSPVALRPAWCLPLVPLYLPGSRGVACVGASVAGPILKMAAPAGPPIQGVALSFCISDLHIIG